MTNHEEEFLSEIIKSGLTSSPKEIVADGKIHRFSSNGESNDKAGWYVFYKSPIFAGA